MELYAPEQSMRYYRILRIALLFFLVWNMVLLFCFNGTDIPILWMRLFLSIAAAVGMYTGMWYGPVTYFCALALIIFNYGLNVLAAIVDPASADTYLTMLSLLVIMGTLGLGIPSLLYFRRRRNSFRPYPRPVWHPQPAPAMASAMSHPAAGTFSAAPASVPAAPIIPAPAVSVSPAEPVPAVPVTPAPVESSPAAPIIPAPAAPVSADPIVHAPAESAIPAPTAETAAPITSETVEAPSAAAVSPEPVQPVQQISPQPVRETNAVPYPQQPIPAVPPQVHFCRKCGFRLLPDSRFCSRCGSTVEGNGSDVLP